MKLNRFLVTNFRSVVDSGWIETDRVTALIGVNESGKTNLLLPLWKLNPAREGEIKPTSDYPKANFNEIQADPGSYEFITAEFATETLAQEIAALVGGNAKDFDTVQVSRYYDGDYVIEFPNHSHPSSIGKTSFAQMMEKAATEVRAAQPLQKEGVLNEELAKSLDSGLDSLANIQFVTPKNLRIVAKALKDKIPENAAQTSTVLPVFRRAIDEIESLATRFEKPKPGSIKEVTDLVLKHLPKFVYYSNYGNLDSEIYLPQVVHNMTRDDLGAREAAKARTLRVLFGFVRLSPQQVLELGQEVAEAEKTDQTRIAEVAERKRTRTIMLHSAGTELTKKFGNWWKQGDYTFDFQADGNHFRIWVSDAKRPEKVELEDRSTGLQWFLSFYLVFLVESGQGHKNTILLLDEPGLSLHPLAQRDLSVFFENLSSTNQLLYTTHSPFLVDADMLDRARKVYLGEDGSTKASADLRRGSEDPRKAGATYAIYSALNMNVAESLLLGCNPVIVEGPSDQHYLSTIKTLLIADAKISPKREIVFPPSHGAKNAKVVASILSGRDEVLPMALFDGDPIGAKMAADLKNGIYQSAKERVHITDPFVGFANSEIEDLFPPTFLADVIDRVFRQAEERFGDVVKAGEPIVPQIESWAEQQKVVLPDGWKVEVSREAKKRAFAAAKKSFNDDDYARWVKLFEALEG